jgi:hypothetical protein
MTYCPLKPFTVTECKVPQYWGINYQDPNESNAAPPFIGADMQIVVDGGGFCEKMLTAIGAVASEFFLMFAVDFNQAMLMLILTL